MFPHNDNSGVVGWAGMFVVSPRRAASHVVLKTELTNGQIVTSYLDSAARNMGQTELLEAC